MTSPNRTPRDNVAPDGPSSQPTPEWTPEQTARGPVERLLRLGFVLTLVLFLIGGSVLVACQAVQLVRGDGTAVISVSDRLGPPTFEVATLCGLFAFALEYLRHGGRESA